jgi:hypothetical protein
MEKDMLDMNWDKEESQKQEVGPWFQVE